MPATSDQPRIAIVHDWLVSPGGAEKVIQVLHGMYPSAPIYTAAFIPDKFPELASADVRVTWLDRIALAKRRHQLFSLARAAAFRSLDLSEYDIVISSCSAESKYVKTGPNTLHVCYCHTPIRYYWSDYDWYLTHFPIRRLQWLVRIIMPLIIRPLRAMDYRYAQQVNTFIANSKYVAARIARYYDRQSKVIYPPVDVDKFTAKKTHGDYYLIVGRQVAYKRLDIAVDAFNVLNLPLVVAGTGEEIDIQQARANSNIEFLGRVSDKRLIDLYQNAKAFIFPPEEDFGIVPVEAMANGVPVIAYGKGGALETVTDGITGILFRHQTAESLIEAVRLFKPENFDANKIREHALNFSVSTFEKKLADFVNAEYASFRSRLSN